MGDPRKCRKQWKPPRKIWDKARMIEEYKLMGRYGLKNKKEIWKARTELRRIRKIARELLASHSADREQRIQELLGRLKRLGLLGESADLDSVLSLTVEALLERRLQTIVFRKGFAVSPKQARQLIVHGHIYIGNRRVTCPGYLVRKDEEDLIRIDPEIHEKILENAKPKEKQEEKQVQNTEEQTQVQEGEVSANE